MKKRPDENESVEDFIYRICVSKDEIGGWNEVVEKISTRVIRSDKPNMFSLYIHENQINFKKYIGITAQPIQNRWRNGLGYNTQLRFWRSINKYGWDNFNHIIICEKLTESEANNLEIKLIQLFDTRNVKFGYNCGFGGEFSTLGYHNAEGYSIPVYQYGISGDFIAEYPSLMEAERSTGIENSAICACCKGKHAYTKQFRWSYEKLDKLPFFDKSAHKYEYSVKKKVYQYGLDGAYIREYPSLSKAAQVVGVLFKGISSCCLGSVQQYKGFIWRYEYSDRVMPVKDRYVRMAETYHNNLKNKTNGVTGCA